VASSKDLDVGTAADQQVRIVLCGPIGSGKTTVGRLLAVRGATVIEADRLGHGVLEPNGEAFDDVGARWPGVVVDGRIDRGALAAIVFADRSQLTELEAMTHPHIGRRIADAAKTAGPVVVVELPLTSDIVGNGWRRLVVNAPEDLRAMRAIARGMTPDDVQRRIAVQPSEAEWRAVADWVIVNDGDLATLERRVEEWWRTVIQPPAT
jgi:dephospho-CoA kinase